MRSGVVGRVMEEPLGQLKGAWPRCTRRLQGGVQPTGGCQQRHWGFCVDDALNHIGQAGSLHTGGVLWGYGDALSTPVHAWRGTLVTPVAC